jgi:phage gp29-like protein
LTGRPEDTVWNPDSYEPRLRFWSVFDNGLINYSYAYMTAPDKNRHIVYRCGLLNGIAQENQGGLGRALLWWSIMAQMGVDKFLNCLQRYGMPFIVAKVDTAQVDTVNAMFQEFRDNSVLNAITVNKDATIELQQMNMSNAAEAHSMFVQFCHEQISLIINHETLSSHAKATGMGSGVADLQGDVRKDIIKYDRICLNNVLRPGLFKQLLDLNGIKGRPPIITWMGNTTSEEKVQISNAIKNLKDAGISIADDSMNDLSDQFGLRLMKSEVIAQNSNIAPNNKDNAASNEDEHPELITQADKEEETGDLDEH